MKRDPAADDASYRLLIEAVVDYAIYLVDLDGRVQTWNPGGERSKGYRAEEIIGQHFSLFFPEETVVGDCLKPRSRRPRRAGRFEERAGALRKDGAGSGRVVITAVRDHPGDADRLRQGHARPDRQARRRSRR